MKAINRTRKNTRRGLAGASPSAAPALPREITKGRSKPRRDSQSKQRPGPQWRLWWIFACVALLASEAPASAQGRFSLAASEVGSGRLAAGERFSAVASVVAGTSTKNVTHSPVPSGRLLDLPVIVHLPRGFHLGGRVLHRPVTCFDSVQSGSGGGISCRVVRLDGQGGEVHQVL